MQHDIKIVDNKLKINALTSHSSTLILVALYVYRIEINAYISATFTEHGML